MLYDLSIGWTPSTSAADLTHTLAMSAELGYDVVALDHVYNGPVPATINNPLPTELPTATSGGRKRRLPRILRRATVIVSDMTVNHRLASVAAAYDLVAVRPTTEKAFQAACLSMAEPSLISLDLTTYFPFFFKHRTAMAAVRRGVLFEVCYAQALRAAASSDGNANSNAAATAAANRARALFVANLAGLVRATRGRGIVVSSGAADAMELRGPADVVNLLAVWGLAPDRGTEALSGLPRSVVANEGLRRRGFRGVVDIVQTADDGQSGDQQQKEKGKQKQKQKQKQGQGNGAAGSKRKADGHNGAGEAEAVAEPATAAAAAAQTKTKQGERQTKKQKRSTAR